MLSCEFLSNVALETFTRDLFIHAGRAKQKQILYEGQPLDLTLEVISSLNY